MPSGCPPPTKRRASGRPTRSFVEPTIWSLLTSIPTRFGEMSGITPRPLAGTTSNGEPAVPGRYKCDLRGDAASCKPQGRSEDASVWRPDRDRFDRLAGAVVRLG